jgi:hypothetical protein
MTRFAPTCPPQILRGLRDDFAMGDYHLLLAHDVVKRPQEYGELFGVEREPFRHVIMDNSVVELGNASSLEAVVDAVRITFADVVVLPDVYGEGPETLKSISDSFPMWQAAISSLQYNNIPMQYMLVPQGRTLQEWADCCKGLAALVGAFSNYSSFWWGVPRIFQERLGKSRTEAVMLMRQYMPDWPIHLLGFSEDIEDDFRTARLPCVTGIDSAVPLRAATLGIPFNQNTKLPPRGDWWDSCTYTPEMAVNVMKVRALIG